MAEPGNKRTQPKAEAKPKGPAERPEVAQFLQWKRNGTQIHWQLIDGSTVIGCLNWFDNYNVQVSTEDLGDVTIPKHSILWYREAAQPQAGRRTQAGGAPADGLPGEKCTDLSVEGDPQGEQAADLAADSGGEARGADPHLGGGRWAASCSNSTRL